MILQSDVFKAETTASAHEKDIDCEEKNEVEEEEERINHSGNWCVLLESDFIIHVCAYIKVNDFIHLEVCDPPPEFFYKA